jgi:hypothetical protein
MSVLEACRTLPYRHAIAAGALRQVQRVVGAFDALNGGEAGLDLRDTDRDGDRDVSAEVIWQFEVGDLAAQTLGEMPRIALRSMPGAQMRNSSPP